MSTRLHDTLTAFGWMSIAAHRSIAVLIAGRLVSGPLLGAVGEETRGTLVHLHEQGLHEQGLHEQGGLPALASTPWRIAGHAFELETQPAGALEPSQARGRRAMHAGAAPNHHVVDRDRTLTRMLGTRAGRLRPGRFERPG